MPSQNAEPAAPSTTYKHIVVVHGIGDQVPNETALNFMNEFLRALRKDGYKLIVNNLIQDLEGLHPGDVTKGRRPSFRPSFAIATRGADRYIIGFSEVWWQYITNGYLELYGGSTPIPIFTWAHSINTRFLRGGRKFHVAADAINNLEKMLKLLRALAFIYKQSGKFVDILDRFLGDVEMYTESEIIRGQINDRFRSVLARVPIFAEETRRQIQQTDPDIDFDAEHPEIYVVAHSEGTVVSYSTLVEAFEDHAAWAPMVKGLVTLGSPLDKHYTVWNNAFRRHVYRGDPRDRKILWRNYWDVSDPVGYGLKVLFTSHNRPDPDLDASKLFRVISDEPFARYPIPGLAHVGYWTDPDIHAEIIYRIMLMGTGEQHPVVKSRWWGSGPIQNIVDRVAYYAGRMVTICAAVFFLDKLLGGLNLLLARFGPIYQALIPALDAWATRLIEQPTSVRDVNAAFWVLAPFLVSEALWSLYLQTRGALADLFIGLRRLVNALWALLVVAVCVALSETAAAAPLKDYLGYATGLVVAFLAWNLHTTVHLGIVQLWRYTKGWETRYEAEEIGGGQKPPKPGRPSGTKTKAAGM